MARLLCWLGRHRYRNVGYQSKATNAWTTVAWTHECERCGRRVYR